MDVNPAAIPIQIARAYGIEQALSAARARPIAPAHPVSPVASASLPNGAQRLVASLVPGGIDFSGDEPAQRGPTLAMYASPSDRNAAATSIQAGRVIDATA